MLIRGNIEVSKGDFKSIEVVSDGIRSLKSGDIQVLVYDASKYLSGYKLLDGCEYTYGSGLAKEVFERLRSYLRMDMKKEAVQVGEMLGFCSSGNVGGYAVKVTELLGEFESLEAVGENSLFLRVVDGALASSFPDDAWVKSSTESVLSSEFSSFNVLASGEEQMPVLRSVDEIMLTKDVEWLKHVRYFVVQDEETAESIFSFLENYNGYIAYDIESTGLKLNCFSKIGSRYRDDLAKWNYEHPDSKVEADRVCGVIFCVEEGVSYYFPCYSKMYKVLYEGESEYRAKLEQEMMRKYLPKERGGEGQFGLTGDLGRYVSGLSTLKDITPDVLLFERIRGILERGNLVTHGGSIEYKAGLIYDINTNIVEDTLLMHQIMLKFKDGRTIPSDLKSVTKDILGIDQWTLKDFFVNYKENEAESGKVDRSGKAKINFSYMTLDGTKVYGPADGDMTLRLFRYMFAKLRSDCPELEYLYRIEVWALRAVGYVEFYGHVLDEESLWEVRLETSALRDLAESKIRILSGYAVEGEEAARSNLEAVLASYNDDSKLKSERASIEEVDRAAKVLEEYLAVGDLNFNSVQQMAELFYDVLGIERIDGSNSLRSEVIEKLASKRTESGEVKYPIMQAFVDYREYVTRLSKFFDNLPDFMFPGGYIFSSYGQIATNTGRMSCKKPNAQQYPKNIASRVTGRKGYVVSSVDYAQIELRVMAGEAGETGLIEKMNDPDNDIHTLIASAMYEVPYADVLPDMRKTAKTFNFGIPFGMGTGRFAMTLYKSNSKEARAKAKEKVEQYFQPIPRIKQFFETTKEIARVRRETRTAFNRKREYNFFDKDGNFSDEKMAAAMRESCNARIQGTAADIFKVALGRVFKYIVDNGLWGELLIFNMVHDELDFEINCEKLNVKKVLADITRCMQYHIPNYPEIFVGAGIGSNWKDAKGGDAELHPMLVAEFMEESESEDLWVTEPKDEAYWIEYMSKRKKEFFDKKIYNYLVERSNWGVTLHPVIQTQLKSEYGGLSKAAGFEGESAALDYFISLHEDLKGLGISSATFKAGNDVVSKEADEVEDIELLKSFGEENGSGSVSKSNFEVLSEDSKVLGVSLGSLVDTFGFVKLDSERCVAVDVSNFSDKQISKLSSIFERGACASDGYKFYYYKAGKVLESDIILSDGVLSELEDLCFERQVV